ncbi:MAG: PrgI family mobile element protein, partial [Acidimicrobiales bacterium]
MDRPDKLLAGLTARQLALLAVAALGLWAGYAATRHVVPPALYGALAIPVAAAACLLALGRIEGVPADRWVLSAWSQHRAAHRLVPAPDGVPPVPACLSALNARGAGTKKAGLPSPLRLPLTGVEESGVLDLGGEGLAVLCRASAVTFSLRTPQEQEALVAGFARYLNSLAEPVQVLVRAEPLDVTPAVDRLLAAAPGLPHVALERACRDHAAFVAELAATRTLLRREVLVVLRQPKGRSAGPRAASEDDVPEEDAGTDGAARLLRRATEAAGALAAAGVSLSVLDGTAVAAVLARCLDPQGPARPGASWATSDEPVTR